MPCEGLMLLPLYDNFKLADVMPIDCGMSFCFVYNGWCYCHGFIFLADVNANVWYVMCGRCYSHVGGGLAVVSQANMADVIATRVWSYFNFSSVMLFRTSSHTCGRWYLPIFLLRDGLFTLMYIASLISLM